MNNISILIGFDGKEDFYFSLDETKLNSEVPDWAQFAIEPCPGHHLHGPDIDFCRLSCQLQHIVEYFKDIHSVDKGLLSIFEDNARETRIYTDAQSIFFHIVFLILSNTSCSVFIKDQHFRRHYVLSAKPQDIFYTYFSIFLVDSFLNDATQPVDLDKLKAQFKLEIDVLNSLIRRLNLASKDDGADASRNGLIIFEGLLQLMEINFDEYIKELEETILKKSGQNSD